MKSSPNIYIPAEAVIKEVRPLTGDVSQFVIGNNGKLKYRPGQFFMVSVFGAGEVPISVASAEGEPLAFCIRRVGQVTGAIHALRAGDSLGLRGPYGNGFSLEHAKGKDVLIMAGGLGIVPLRPLVQEIINNRGDFGNIALLYGTKSPVDVLFRDDAEDWESEGLKVIYTVDCADEGWRGCVGVVTSLLGQVDMEMSKAAGFICGPHVMINSAMRELSVRGMPDDMITTTLEAHMKCGVGKCGHCYRGKGYVCTDGPVFTLAELKRLGEG